MAIASQWPGKCKDCGTAHAIGDMIDKNGKESPNKEGVTKAHWCKNGKNCHGAMTLENTSWPDIEGTGGIKITNMQTAYDGLTEEEKTHTEYVIIHEYIKVLKACQLMKITEKPEIGMLFNNHMRRLER